MNNQIIIALDVMGGDNAPHEIVKGAVTAAANSRIKLLLVGNNDKINEELKKNNYSGNNIEIINTTEVVESTDVPTIAIKQKKDSSMVVGLNLVKEGKANAFVSAGNTGALLTGATLIVGRIKGIERPAIGTLLPNTDKTFTMLVDSGANVDCKPSYLVQFAKMGAVYMENILNIKNPRVGLVNIGTEKEKGNAVVKEVFELLSNDNNINFAGNIEASEVSEGVADVLTCDGFVGNIILKHSEGLSKSLLKVIKTELMSSTLSKLGAMLAKDAFKNVKKRFDAEEIGGAPFLGLNSLVVKAHGNSRAKAINAAINQCIAFVDKDIVGKIQAKL